MDFAFGLKRKLKFKVWFLELGGVFSSVKVHKILWESTVPFVPLQIFHIVDLDPSVNSLG